MRRRRRQCVWLGSGVSIDVSAVGVARRRRQIFGSLASWHRHELRPSARLSWRVGVSWLAACRGGAVGGVAGPRRNACMRRKSWRRGRRRRMAWRRGVARNAYFGVLNISASRRLWRRNRRHRHHVMARISGIFGVARRVMRRIGGGSAA